VSGPGWIFRSPIRPWPQRRTPAVELPPAVALNASANPVGIVFNVTATGALGTTVQAAATPATPVFNVTAGGVIQAVPGAWLSGLNGVFYVEQITLTIVPGQVVTATWTLFDNQQGVL